MIQPSSAAETQETMARWLKAHDNQASSASSGVKVLAFESCLPGLQPAKQQDVHPHCNGASARAASAQDKNRDVTKT
jgi:hypothetical protein